MRYLQRGKEHEACLLLNHPQAKAFQNIMDTAQTLNSILISKGKAEVAFYSADDLIKIASSHMIGDYSGEFISHDTALAGLSISNLFWESLETVLDEPIPPVYRKTFLA